MMQAISRSTPGTHITINHSDCVLIARSVLRMKKTAKEMKSFINKGHTLYFEEDGKKKRKFSFNVLFGHTVFTVFFD